MRGRRVIDAGRRPTAGQGVAPTALARATKAFSALFAPGDSWFEADNVSGSDWVDYKDPSHRLVLAAGVLAAPAPDALFGGAKTFAYTGTQRSVSNRAASAWKSGSDGTGGTRILLAAPTSLPTQLFYATNTTGSTGQGMYGSGSNPGLAVYNTGVGIVNGVGGALAAGVAFAATCMYATANWAFRFNGAVVASGGVTVPDTGNPGAPLTLGSDGSGGNPAFARYEAFVDFRRVLTAPELAVAAAYFFAKTGRTL